MCIVRSSLYVSLYARMCAIYIRNGKWLFIMWLRFSSMFLPIWTIFKRQFTLFNSLPSRSRHFNSIQFSAVEVNDPHIVIDKHSVTTRRYNESDNPLFLREEKKTINCSFRSVVHLFVALHTPCECLLANASNVPYIWLAGSENNSWKTMGTCL